MSTEHHILKAILSCSIFFVKPSGNVLSWVNFLSWDSVVGMTKIMVKEGKGPGQHISPVSSTMKIVSKHLFCPMNNHRQRFLQKTTWATIMSQDDKTCIIACLLLSMHKNWILQCVPISPYNYAFGSKQVFDISLTVSMGHLIVYIPVPRWHKHLVSQSVPTPSFFAFKTFPVYFLGLKLSLRSKV